MGLLEDALRAYAKFEDLTEDPATPASGAGLVYFKAGKLHQIDDTGTVTDLTEAGAGGGGDGATTLIEEVELSSDTSSVTFSSIPGTYRHLKLVCLARTDRSSTADTLGGYLNGDTGSNYARRIMTEGGSNRSTGDPQAIFGRLASASATTGMPGTSDTTFAHYTNTTFNAQWVSVSGAGDNEFWNTAGTWANTDAITSIELVPNAGTVFLAGALFSLYGMA